MTGDYIMNEIQRGIQSNSKYAEMRIDTSMKISVAVVEYKEKAKRGAEPNITGASGRGRTIQNQDNLCLARSLAVGFALAERDAVAERLKIDNVERFLEDKKPNNIDYNAMHSAHTRYLQVKRREALQKKAAKAILKKANISPNLPSYTLDHLQLIQDSVMGDFKITLFKFMPNPGEEALVWPKEDEVLPSGKPVDIAFRPARTANGPGHYDLCVNREQYIGRGKHCCPKCNGFSSNGTVHRCQYKCVKCHSRNGQCQGNDTMGCGLCGVDFPSSECFNNHVKINSRGTSVCRQFKLHTCGKYFRVSTGCSYCGTPFCGVCKQRHPRSEPCYWKKPDEKEKTDLRKRQQDRRTVYFDIESRQAREDPASPSKFIYEDRHTAAVICTSEACGKCKGDLNPNQPCGCDMDRVFMYPDDSDDDSNVAKEFALWAITDKRKEEAIFISHFGGGYDMHFIYSIYVKMELTVDIISNGARIIQMRTKKGTLLDGTKIYSTWWRDSWAYMQLPLSAFPTTFDLGIGSKGIFPFLYIEKKNYHSKSKEFPALKYFAVNKLSAEEREKLIQWHQDKTLKYRNDPRKFFDFNKKVVKYCKLDVLLTKKGCLKYIDIMESLTSWNPFVQAVSIASFTLFVFRMNYLQNRFLVHLPEAGYDAHEHQSEEAEKYFFWLEKERDRQLVHYGRGPEHQIPYGKRTYKVDCLDPQTNEIIEWHGCAFHGCRLCAPNRNEKHPLTNRTPDEDLFRTERKEADLRGFIGRDGQPLYKYKAIWSHELPEMLKQNPAMAKFFKEFKFVGRLRPREALQGGRTGTLRLLWDQKKDGGVFYIVDVKSL